MKEYNKIKRIVQKFKITSEPYRIEVNDNGLINKSYIVKCKEEDYIIQKINNYVFNDPDKLMKNIILISQHLLKYNNQNLKIIKTNDNKNYLVDNNEYYRCYSYIKNGISFDYTNNSLILYEFGKTLGYFQMYLNNFETSKLYETIENFHNTPARLVTLIEKFDQSSIELQEEVTDLYQYIIRNEKYFNNIMEALERKDIPYAVVHNDTKLNNCLFNRYNQKGICLIDLDTVMKGSRLYDVGDAIRSSVATEKEDSKRFELIDIDLNKFVHFIIGYLEIMKSVLCEKEIELIVDSIIIISFECSMRFLTDYLDNNKYFHIDYEKHNLVRSINQMMFAKRVIDRKDSLNKIVKNIVKHLES